MNLAGVRKLAGTEKIHIGHEQHSYAVVVYDEICSIPSYLFPVSWFAATTNDFIKKLKESNKEYRKRLHTRHAPIIIYDSS